MQIPFVYCPNYKKGRSGGGKITHIVIHTMQGFYNGTKQWFQNPKAQVSAHYLVSKKGEVCQMVKEQDTAWHVCMANPFTIGIELEDASWAPPDPHTGKRRIMNSLTDANWYTPAQLDVLATLVADLCNRYHLPVERVIGHNDKLLRGYGNNHADPGPYFPWDRFRKMVSDRMHPQTPPSSIPSAGSG